MLWRRKNSLYKWISAAFLFVVVLTLAAQAQSSRIKSGKQETPVQMLDAAMQAVQDADFVKAENLLKKVIVAESGNTRAHTLAGIVADHENKLGEAENHFSAAARLSPKSAEAHNNYGAILLRLKRPAEAAKEFSASLTINPNQPSALVNLSQIKFTENTPQSLREAKNLLTKASEITPDAEILRALVLVNLRLNEKAEAARVYQNYSTLESGSNLTAQIELGTLLAESNLFNEAIREFQSALKSEPSNVEALTGLARLYTNQKDIKSAGRLLESAVASGATDARIYAALADVYQAGNYFENAIPAMRLAIEADKANEAYRYRYGMLLIDTKAPAAAVIRLKEAIGDFPRSPRLWLGLGIAQFYDSKLNDAQQSLEKALSFDPKLVPAFAYLAAIKNVGGQAAEAAVYYGRALAIDDNSAVLHYLLADTLLKEAAADNVKVEKHLKRAIELDARIAAAHLALGRLYARQKNFAEAAAELEKTVALEPNQTEAYYQLGQIYGRLKRSEESRTALAKFKQLSEQEKTQTKSDYSELVRRLANVKF